MLQGLQISALGRLEIRLDRVLLSNLHSRKAEALLVYLACNATPHARELLSEMLWDDRSQAQSLGNLRVVLNRLKKALDSYLDLSPRAVGLQSDSFWLDKAEFDQHYRLYQNRSANSPDFASLAPSLERAAELYRGAFLAGFHVADASGYEQWMLMEQNQTERQVSELLHFLGEHYLAVGNFQAGLVHATRLTRINPLHESAHRLMMRLFASSDQRSAALAQYEQCQQLLADELGIEPDDETVELYEKIRVGGFVSTARLAADQPVTPAFSVMAYQLPSQATPFIGRTSELAHIARLLADSDCRLLALVGPGGIGKTRLAIQAGAEQRQTFAHGVCFVSLAAINTSDLLVSTIAEALAFSFYSPENAQEQLINYLRFKHILLILDNFEHLIEGVTLLNQLLAAAPGLKILVTSHQRLNLREAWLLEVQGLSYPTDSADPTDTALENYDAVQLFNQIAMRLRPEFSLRAEMAAVVRICQLFEGLPLGIELAAAWVRMMTCAEIAIRGASRPEMLTTIWRNVPERHHSLWTTFEHTWQLLTIDEQRPFMCLSIFRNGFDAEAAQSVADASYATLIGLVDKSLLRYSRDTGRYRMHALLRQFATDKLFQSGEAAAIIIRHCEYFYKLTDDGETKLQTAHQLAWRDRYNADLDNLRAVLEWSFTHDEQLQAGLQMAGNLAWFWVLTNRIPEGLAWYQKILNHPAAHVTTWARGWALHGASALACLAGYQTVARPFILESREIAVRLNDDLLLAQALYGLTFGLREDHRQREALPFVQHSVALCIKLQNDVALALAYSAQGWVYLDLDDAPMALFSFEQCLAISRRLGNVFIIASTLYFLSAIALRMGKVDDAQRQIEDALQMYRRFGDHFDYVWAQGMLATVHAKQGNFDQVYRLAKERCATYRDLGFYTRLADSLFELGNLAYQFQDMADARAYLEECLTLHQRLNNQVGMAACTEALRQLVLEAN